MNKLLRFYQGLEVEEQVRDIEIYLQNFRQELYKANQAQVIINEIFKECYQLSHSGGSSSSAKRVNSLQHSKDIATLKNMFEPALP